MMKLHDEANLASAAVTIKPTVNADLRWGAYLSMRKDYRAQHEWIVSGWPKRHRFYGPANRVHPARLRPPAQVQAPPIRATLRDSAAARNRMRFFPLAVPSSPLAEIEHNPTPRVLALTGR